MQHVTPWSTSGREIDSCVAYPGMLLGLSEFLVVLSKPTSFCDFAFTTHAFRAQICNNDSYLI